MSTTTSTNVIIYLKSIFSRHGVPETVRFDNRLQYSSEQFIEFANQYGFSHITNSFSNGAAKRAVRTIKDLLKENKTHNGDMYMAMLAYRFTPLENGLSPAKLLMGQKLRTSVPVEPKQLNPKVPNQSQLRQKDQQQEKQGQNFNKSHRAVISKPMKKGDNVWLPEMEKKRTVIKQKGACSYLVKTDNGSVYQRNRKHLNWLPMNVDREVLFQPNELISILPQNPPSDATPMTYQTRSGKTIKAPIQYHDPGTT